MVKHIYKKKIHKKLTNLLREENRLNSLEIKENLNGAIFICSFVSFPFISSVFSILGFVFLTPPSPAKKGNFVNRSHHANQYVVPLFFSLFFFFQPYSNPLGGVKPWNSTHKSIMLPHNGYQMTPYSLFVSFPFIS